MGQLFLMTGEEAASIYKKRRVLSGKVSSVGHTRFTIITVPSKAGTVTLQIHPLALGVPRHPITVEIRADLWLKRTGGTNGWNRWEGGVIRIYAIT